MTWTAPSRLIIDGDALVANWRTMARLSGTAACGAAIKANGYGLGAREVADRLVMAGCRDLFVSTWGEAMALGSVGPATVSVLHGVREEDMAVVGLPGVRPVLNTPEQVRRWREAGRGACDVMVDTGMNRLGISPQDIADGLVDGLQIETLMSHLACADEDSPMNEAQRNIFADLVDRTASRRMSLANSAAIAAGGKYAFDLTRPGLALYGGVPRDELTHVIEPVVSIEAQVIQRRAVVSGAAVGYNATWTAATSTELAVVNCGYADGFSRAFSNIGNGRFEDIILPVVGRVSMDLIVFDVSATPALVEGDWVILDFVLSTAATVAGLSQYELLTGLGGRFARVWS